MNNKSVKELTFQNLQESLELGFKIKEFKKSPDGVDFKLIGYEKEDNSNELYEYDIKVLNSKELSEFVNNLENSNETIEKRFLLRNVIKGFVLIDIINFSTRSIEFQIGLLSRFQTILI